MSSIFLSHNHRDKPFVRRLGQDLQAEGILVWIDEAEILVGDSLIGKIETGIDGMDYLGVVLSNNSVQSEWVNREVRIALDREINHRRVTVLPILIEECPIPGFLRGKAYADFRSNDNYGAAFQELLRSLKRGPPSSFAPRPEPRTSPTRPRLIMISLSILGVSVLVATITIRSYPDSCYLRDLSSPGFTKSATRRACLPGVATAFTWPESGDQSACTNCNNRAIQYVPEPSEDKRLFTEYYLVGTPPSHLTWKKAHVWELLHTRANRGSGSHEEGAILGRVDRDEWVCDESRRRLRLELFVSAEADEPILRARWFPVSAGASVVLHSVWNLSGCWRE